MAGSLDVEGWFNWFVYVVISVGCLRVGFEIEVEERGNHENEYYNNLELPRFRAFYSDPPPLTFEFIRSLITVF